MATICWWWINLPGSLREFAHEVTSALSAATHYKKGILRSGCRFPFRQAHLFFRDPHLDHPIHHPHWVGRHIHHNRHLHSFPRPHIHLAAMPRANNIIAFQVAFSDGAIIMSTNIANGKKLFCDVEDHKRFTLNFDKQTLPIGKFRCGSDFEKLSFGFVKSSVIEHNIYSIKLSLASPSP